MERVEKVLKMPSQQFKRIIGTTKPVFRTMIDILQVAYDKLHEPGGQPATLTVGDKLLITLEYYREYRTMERIAMNYGCSKSSVSRSINWVEDTLSADGRFQLLGKQALQDATQNGTIKTVAIDVTEHPIERPKKKQEDWYSGKQKEHTIKSQIIADTVSRLIYDVDEAMGSVHDFTLCKQTLLQLLFLYVIILADSGYQGIRDYHEWSLIPVKASKNRPLSESEKAFNRELSRRRICIENINAQIKVFKIMSYPYRNRRRRHLLRTKLICAILNAERAV